METVNTRIGEGEGGGGTCTLKDIYLTVDVVHNVKTLFQNISDKIIHSFRRGLFVIHLLYY